MPPNIDVFVTKCGESNIMPLMEYRQTS